MAYEQREGSATLFRNDKKSSDKATDWRGEGMLNGELIEIAAWEKSGSRGTFFSLNLKNKQAYTPKSNMSYEEGKQADKDFGLDDDTIPF